MLGKRRPNDCCLTCANSSPWLLLSSFFPYICLPYSHSFPAISFPLCQPVKSKLAVKCSSSARSCMQAPGENKRYELYRPTVKYRIWPQWDIQKSLLKASSLDCFPFQHSFPTVDLLLNRERIRGKNGLMNGGRVLLHWLKNSIKSFGNEERWSGTQMIDDQSHGSDCPHATVSRKTMKRQFVQMSRAKLHKQTNLELLI